MQNPGWINQPGFSFIFALAIFTARAIYRPAVASVRGHLQAEKASTFLWRFMFALPISRLGQLSSAVATVQWTVAGSIVNAKIKEKKNQAEAWFLVFALPIFTVRATILCR